MARRNAGRRVNDLSCNVDARTPGRPEHFLHKTCCDLYCRYVATMKMMAAVDDAEDIAAFDAALAEEGDNIPWDEVKADLGWV